MNQQFNKGLFLTSLGSFWWGFIGVIYFQYVSFIGHIELVVHRCLWTAVMLIITTSFFSKWNIFFRILKNKKELLFLFISGFLIFINWAVWIYAVATNRIIDASFGYFIMPIISVLLGYIFFRESLNKKRILSISINNFNDFNFSNIGLSLFLILAGPMTVIPLFLYVRGVELIGLGPTGMIFYITPTLQFILGYFYYNEPFSLMKFVSFIIIWIAVIIYLKDLYEKN